ncbi:MAG TPA: hypothetical protein VGN44_17265 [Candidatus Angelobacter sp.]
MDYKSSIFNRGQGENDFPLEVGGKQFTLLVKHEPANAGGFIDLLDSGQQAKTILHIDQKVRKVTKAEYNAVFDQK